jgi:hypothetical protein
MGASVELEYQESRPGDKAQRLKDREPKNRI